MKIHFTIFLAILLLTSACADRAKGQVPEVVKKAFQAKYPGEDDPDWETDSNGFFESSFKIDGKHYRADFDQEGNWIETERSIDFDELPEPVREKIENEYDSSDITEIEEVEHPRKGLFFDIEFKRSGKNKDVELDKNGKEIN